MIIGTDISHWEDNPNTPQRIDFDQMKAAGAEFCIFKATQGKYFVDKVFEADYNRAANLLRGVYHFLDWTADADRQAEHFCNTIAGHKLDFPPIVDFECRANPPDQKTATSELWGFVVAIERITGRVPIIYTGPSYWKEYGSKDKVWRKYPLWIANYQVTKPIIPNPWDEYFLWQYTDRGDGLAYGCEAKAVDLNYFDGTLAELRRRLGLDAPTKPEPTDQEKLEKLWAAHPELH